MSIRLLAHGLRALLLVAYRRSLKKKGPSWPRWPFRFELLVELMRIHSRWLATLSPVAARRAAEALTRPAPPGVELRDESLGGVPCTWFTPAQAERGTLLFVHGGAFVFGSARQAKGTIGELALRLRRQVVAPDYRLAPEHPCPAAVQDVSRVYRVLLERGVAPETISIAGESAGANIVLAALQALRDARAPLPDSCVLLSPAVDLSGCSPSWSANRGIDFGDPSDVLRYHLMYAGGLSLSDPRVSPLHGSLAGLPRCLVVAGSVELFADDARAFVAKARSAGVDAKLLLGEDMVHAYASFGPLTSRTEEALTAVVDFTFPSTVLSPRQPASSRIADT
jgi:epsilon-lactone hydrolase